MLDKIIIEQKTLRRKNACMKNWMYGKMDGMKIVLYEEMME